MLFERVKPFRRAICGTVIDRHKLPRKTCLVESLADAFDERLDVARKTDFVWCARPRPWWCSSISGFAVVLRLRWCANT